MGPKAKGAAKAMKCAPKPKASPKPKKPRSKKGSGDVTVLPAPVESHPLQETAAMASAEQVDANVCVASSRGDDKGQDGEFADTDSLCSRDTPSKGKRIRIDRRDVEQQCKRLCEDALYPRFGKSVTSKVNKKGQTVWAWMMDKLNVLQESGKYWTSKITLDLCKEYDLLDDIGKRLPKPEVCEPPRPELLEMLALVHAKNPVDRSSGPLERFLENVVPALTECESFGILSACGESPVVSKLLHQRSFLAMLTYMGRIVLYIYLY
jgi:hypothetical protein